MREEVEKERRIFEHWAATPPREWDLSRFGELDAWPGQYRDYHVKCAWEAWLYVAIGDYE